MAGSETPAPLVALRGVTKRFGEVVANNTVDIEIGRGEVVALVGENGAGKSTIVNMLSGVFPPDEGRIEIDGAAARFTSPGDAVAAGIGVVHQHYMLVPTLSALDNLALQASEIGLGRIDRAALGRRAGEVAERLGFSFERNQRIDSLDVAHQQRIEIIKALMHDVRLLVLDEPTAVLGAEDKARLFETIRELRSRGVSVVLITHKLDDVFAVADRAVILRNGAVAAMLAVEGLAPEIVVRHMVGSGDAPAVAGLAAPQGDDDGPIAVPEEHAAQVVCRVRDVTLHRPNGSVAVAGLSFDLRAGEIVAVAGVDGNGQGEFVRCMAGMERPAAGTIECFGLTSDRRDWTAARLRRHGVSHIPEDRRRSGIVADMSLAKNYLLSHLDRSDFSRFGLLRNRRLSEVVADRLVRYGVRARGSGDRMGNLSGGNQQKVVLARELDGDPHLILAAHPSRGLDLKTIDFVHTVLGEARAAGKAVLLLSSDIDEILALADRIVVFASGRSFGPARREDVDRRTIGGWIAGHADLPA
ncbi:ABC transporter ATP-binding protein [Microbaculum marinum]|uniref:ABC transporter ATP-binding protein n=1 Tax=Microbaculum marinum TaxID=1764581 RepID=A0AAW9RKH9_9HYPH